MSVFVVVGFLFVCLDGRRQLLSWMRSVCVCEGGGGRGSKMFELNL